MESTKKSITNRIENVKSYILHKWNVYLWEREVRKETNIAASNLGIKKNSLPYVNLMSHIASNLNYVEGFRCPACFHDNTGTYAKMKSQSCVECGYNDIAEETNQFTDLEMAKNLVDYGYDVEFDELSSTFNTQIVVEMAINEGFKWNEETGLWG